MKPISSPDPKTSAETLSGIVECVTFCSEETGFHVLKVQVRGHTDLVTVVGTAPELRAGEWLDATGRWTVDSQYGQQFRAETLRTTRPNTAEGIKRYLSSGLIKGIGPAFAERMVDHFGVQVFEIIEGAPERLREVRGIGAGRQAKILSAWKDQKAVRDIMVFLHSHVVTTSRAFRIYKAYGDQAIENVREDPYRLARDIWGIGFKSADKIAENLGIGRQSDLRARAGVEYVLQELTNDGHCAYPREDLTKKATAMLEIPSEIVGIAIDHELASERLVAVDHADGRKLIYLAALEAAERRLARLLIDLSRQAHPCPAIDIEKAIPWVEKKVGLTIAASQREALALAMKSKVLVITGGPGVGKTTLVKCDPEDLPRQESRRCSVRAHRTGGKAHVRDDWAGSQHDPPLAEVRSRRGRF